MFRKCFDVDLLLRETVVELIQQGRLTGDGIRFDGELIQTDTGLYRDDGWSVETLHGCRYHRAIDEAIAAYRDSEDEFDRQAADQVKRWWAFDPRRAPDELPEDQETRSDILQAYLRWSGVMFQMPSRSIALFPLERGGSPHPVTIHEDCGIALVNAREVSIVETLPQRVLDELRAVSTRLRREAEDA